ncbi:hypothetical protein [Bdellovibrio sp.]
MSNKKNTRVPLGYEWIYTPYITRNGRRIYRGGGRMFRFLAPKK